MANVVTIELNDNLYRKTKKTSNYEIPKNYIHNCLYDYTLYDFCAG